jgi:hypothetical protein
MSTARTRHDGGERSRAEGQTSARPRCQRTGRARAEAGRSRTRPHAAPGRRQGSPSSRWFTRHGEASSRRTRSAGGLSSTHRSLTIARVAGEGGMRSPTLGARRGSPAHPAGRWRQADKPPRPRSTFRQPPASLTGPAPVHHGIPSRSPASRFHGPVRGRGVGRGASSGPQETACSEPVLSVGRRRRSARPPRSTGRGRARCRCAPHSPGSPSARPSRCPLAPPPEPPAGAGPGNPPA